MANKSLAFIFLCFFLGTPSLFAQTPIWSPFHPQVTFYIDFEFPGTRINKPPFMPTKIYDANQDGIADYFIDHIMEAQDSTIYSISNSNQATYYPHSAPTYFGRYISYGDFNGDGTPDFLGVNNALEYQIALMGGVNGLEMQQVKLVTTLYADLNPRPDRIEFLGVGDHNGDGHDDAYFTYYYKGKKKAIAVWHIHNAQLVDKVILKKFKSNKEPIAILADNPDLKTQILQHSMKVNKKKVVVKYQIGKAKLKMKGVNLHTRYNINRLIGVADFDKNGYMDLLFQSGDPGTPGLPSDILLYLNKGKSFDKPIVLASVTTDFNVQGFSQFTNDGVPDLVFYNISTFTFTLMDLMPDLSVRYLPFDPVQPIAENFLDYIVNPNDYFILRVP